MLCQDVHVNMLSILKTGLLIKQIVKIIWKIQNVEGADSAVVRNPSSTAAAWVQ